MNQNALNTRVLIVDDDAVTRMMASEALTDAGFEVVEAASAEEGLALFATSEFDLVLLDLMLPGIDGHEACLRLRLLSAGRNVPILVLTGRDDRESIRRAYDSGATEFIVKPIVWALLPYRVQYALRANKALLDSVRTQALLSRAQRLAHMGSWAWIRASDRLTCSDELLNIHSTTMAEMGQGLMALLHGVHAQDRATVAKALDAARLEGSCWNLEFRIVRADGSLRRLIEQTEVERDHAGQIVAIHGIRHDVTDQAEAADRIHKLSSFDPTTGLANGSLFRQMMQHWLPYAERRKLVCSLLFVGLDRFKRINDSLGPRVADELIRAVGERLRHFVRSSDVTAAARAEGSEELLARHGSDEFALLLVDVGAADLAMRVARRIAGILAAPFMVDGVPITLSASIGIAMTPGDGADGDALLHHAGTAMRNATDDGRSGQIRFYDAEMSADVARKLSVETEIRHAIDRGDELRVHYQPKIDARSSRVIGAEPLLRWQHPRRGLVGPGEFIAVAEESGLIVPITEWVIEDVCRQQAAWRRAGLPTVPVSVNLAAANLEGDELASSIALALARHGLHAADLEFEVTEGSLMRDMKKADRVLRQLRAMGHKLSIDDFGTGYSSIGYLKYLPIDQIKIDHSFVQGGAANESDAT
ncbi:MAG: EAL domain-containing protein, partial [Rhizobacter sp.]|nr:EAL domain-containing protein [Rhizobacter sp.]